MTEKILIGRQECHILCNDTSVSRIHASIRQIDDFHLEVIDTGNPGENGSKNKTWINGKFIDPFKPYLITLSDTLEVGKQKVDFKLHFKDLKPIIKDNYIEEFSKLKDWEEDWRKRFKIIKGKYGKKGIKIKIFITILLFTLAWLFKLELNYYLILTILGFGFAFYKFDETEIDDELEEIEVEKILNWKCPNPNCLKPLNPRWTFNHYYQLFIKDNINDKCEHCKKKWFKS